MILLFLLALLAGPWAVVQAMTWLNPRLTVDSSMAFRAGLTVFLLFTGMGHFAKGPEMAQLLGPGFPFAMEIVHVTGALEVLGAVGVWIPRVRQFTGLCLVVMLIGFLPVNVYAAFQRVPFGGHKAGPVYLLVRIPFQLLVIWWTMRATRVNLRRLESAHA